MTTQRSRQQIQARLKVAMVTELDRLDLPSDGRHLSRIFRALTHLAIDMMQAVEIPDPVTAHLLHKVAKKTLKSVKSASAAGPFGHVPEGKA